MMDSCRTQPNYVSILQRGSFCYLRSVYIGSISGAQIFEIKEFIITIILGRDNLCMQSGYSDSRGDDLAPVPVPAYDERFRLTSSQFVFPGCETRIQGDQICYLLGTTLHNRVPLVSNSSCITAFTCYCLV